MELIKQVLYIVMILQFFSPPQKLIEIPIERLEIGRVARANQNSWERRETEARKIKTPRGAREKEKLRVRGGDGGGGQEG